MELQNNEIKQVEEVVLQFIQTMEKWEVYCAKMDEIDQWDDEDIKERLDQIYAQYCTSKKRILGRQKSLSYSVPPEYDINENIIEIKIDGKKAQVKTQQKVDLESTYFYHLKNVKNKWLIDYRQIEMSDGTLLKETL